jgi:hypothetical protein
MLMPIFAVKNMRNALVRLLNIEDYVAQWNQNIIKDDRVNCTYITPGKCELAVTWFSSSKRNKELSTHTYLICGRVASVAG